MKTIVDLVLFGIIYGLGEFLANTFLFPRLMHKYLKHSPNTAPDKITESKAADASSEAKGKARIKGLLERLMLFMGLAMGIEQVLTLFGALKLGTHFLKKDQKETDEEKISKDYFLIGNLLSVLLAICYLLVWKWLCGIFTLEHLRSVLQCNC